MPGESHGQRRLEGYGSQGHRESDMTEATEHTCMGVWSRAEILETLKKLALI